jgi:stage II sporulation protein D
MEPPVNTRGVLAALGIAVFLITIPACSQTSVPGAVADLTVRLFYSQNVDALTVTPLSQSVTVKRCHQCAALPFHSAISVTRRSATMLVDGAPVPVLEMAGAVRIETNSGRDASAAGRWQLRAARDGLRVTVTLPSERYVMAVLASEASPQEPAASLQALAIAVRSFALTHLHRHASDGFDLCDSTHCQALRLKPVSDAIRIAVEQTAGETLWAHGQRATAYFTQNCGGVTEDAAEVWGGVAHPWLVSHSDPYCQRTPAAWHASLNQDELRQSLALASSPIHKDVSSLRVVKRDQSGRAITLEIVTADQHIRLAATTFRFAVGRSLGWNRLRSDWYTASVENGSAQFDGRGFGHGVGLCQAGASIMATQKLADARAILSFYFPGTEIRISPLDQGWHSASGHGWTLLATSPTQDEILLRAGDRAWARAHELLGIPMQRAASQGNPVSVRVFPSTELFRDSTGEPGWVIGATRGDNISLQPTRVVEVHESLQDAFLHEMLHVLVERDSSATTPLWLREGLVESLTSRTANTHEQMLDVSAIGINAALSLSSSAEQARLAHLAAALYVRRLVAAYGMGEVRRWLRSGVPSGALAKAGLR